MTENLKRLKEIFGDRSDEDLRAILSQNGNDVEASVNAIFSGEVVEARTPTPRTPTMVQIPPTLVCTTPVRGNQQPPDLLGGTPTHTPPTIGNDDTTAMDGDRESSDFAAAIRASTAPSDQGKLVGLFGRDMTPGDLSALMSDPEFVSTLDDGMRAALFLQMQIDSEERSAVLASGGAVSPGSLAPPIPTDAVSWNGGVSNDSNRREEVGAAHPAALLASKWKSALAPATANLEESVRMARGRLARSLAGTSFPRNGDSKSASTDRRLRDDLDDEAEAEAERQRVQEESVAACLQATREHLFEFLSDKPDATYAEWIEALHPENVPDGQLLEGLAKTVDHRFFIEESDHRRMWNEHLTTDGGHRTVVPARNDHVVDLLTGDVFNDSNESSPLVPDSEVDLLRDDTVEETEATTGEVDHGHAKPADDLISFF